MPLVHPVLHIAQSMSALQVVDPEDTISKRLEAGRKSDSSGTPSAKSAQEQRPGMRHLVFGPALGALLAALVLGVLAFLFDSLSFPISSPLFPLWANAWDSNPSAAIVAGQSSQKPPASPFAAEALGSRLDFGLVRVEGQGSRICTVGSFCSFTITTREEASWKVTGAKPFEWDLMVTLRGPALVHVHVAQSKSLKVRGREGLWPGRTFQATYRAWDAGEYVVQLVNPCHTLTSAGGTGNSSKEVRSMAAVLAEWEMVVFAWEQGMEAENTPNSLASSISSSAVGQTDTDTWTRPAKILAQQPLATGSEVGVGVGGVEGYTACSETLGARWKLDASSGAYTWQPYRCARWQALEDILPGLWSRGVREIAFVGDSHLRFLMLHSIYLLTGEAPGELLKAHTDFSIDVTAPSPSTPQQAGGNVHGSGSGLGNAGNVAGSRDRKETRGRAGQEEQVIRFSFYWVDGIYRNGEFGCRRRGQWSKRWNTFPQLLGKADVAVLNAATWTALSCKQPALAYPRYLNGFLSSMVSQLRGLNCSRTFFFGAPPSPVCGAQREYHATNSLLKFQSELSAVESAHYGMRFFNTWEVAAARFENSCTPSNPHYSCPNLPKGATQGTLEGDVGEALAFTFLQLVRKSLDEDGDQVTLV